MSRLILGPEGFKRLQKGYEVNINQSDIKTFTVAQELPTGVRGIAAGQLLITTGITQEYTIVDPAGLAADYVNKIAGIATATNVKLDTVFPHSVDGPLFEPGQKGGVLVKGEIAVELHGPAPVENDAVYFNIAASKFTKDNSASNIVCPNMKFTGITEGALTVVNVLY